MLNYIKSEFYRIFHSSAFYVLTFIFVGISMAFNTVLYLFGRFAPDFHYATTSFSFSNIVSNPMIFSFASLWVASALYDQSKKNGSMKNAVAFGISRTKIFMGQFIVSLAISVIILLLTEAAYISTALLLLPAQGPVTVHDMLMEIIAVFPLAVSALIFGIVLVQLFDHVYIGILVWLCVFSIIPKILFMIGLVVDPVQKLAMWLPQNIFSLMQVNLRQCVTVWDTAQGMARCQISGWIGIAVFAVWGVLVLRKKEM